MQGAKRTYILGLFAAAVLLLSLPCYAAKLVDEDFEDQSIVGSFDPNFSWTVLYTEINSTHTHNGSNYAMEMQDAPGQWGSLKFDISSAQEGDEYYFSYWMYFPAGWSWANINRDTGFKQIQGRSTTGTAQPTILAKGDKCTPTDVYLHTGFIGTSCSTWGDCETWPSIGEWHHFEVYIRYSTTTGGYWFKIDDELMGSITNCNSITGRSEPEPTWFGFPTYNGRGSAGSYWLDDVEIWDEIPAPLVTEGFEQASWTPPNDFNSGFGPTADTSSVTICSDKNGYCVERGTTGDGFPVRTGTYSVVLCNGSTTDGVLDITTTSLGISIVDGTELYFKYYAYYPSGIGYFDAISSTNLKINRVMGSSTAGYPITVLGSQDGGVAQGCSGDETNVWAYFYGQAGNPLFGPQAGACFDMPMNQWVLHEWYVKYASAGQGAYWYKVGGVVRTTGTGYTTYPTADLTVSLFRAIGGNGNPTNGYYFVDDVEVWGYAPEDDTDPPVLDNGYPPAGPPLSCSSDPLAVTVSVDTDENATCKYCVNGVGGCDEDTDYDTMIYTFTTTGGMAHEEPENLVCDSFYVYYLRCEDTAENQNPLSYAISFGIQSRSISRFSGGSGGFGGFGGF